jgi:hypothetical protein
LTANNDNTAANNDDRYQGGFAAATQGYESPSNSGIGDTLITSLGVGFGFLAMIVATVFCGAKFATPKTATAAGAATAANNSTIRKIMPPNMGCCATGVKQRG